MGWGVVRGNLLLLALLTTVLNVLTPMPPPTQVVVQALTGEHVAGAMQLQLTTGAEQVAAGAGAVYLEVMVEREGQLEELEGVLALLLGELPEMAPSMKLAAREEEAVKTLWMKFAISEDSAAGVMETVVVLVLDIVVEMDVDEDEEDEEELEEEDDEDEDEDWVKIELM